jgi:hypothetical protein
MIHNHEFAVFAILDERSTKELLKKFCDYQGRIKTKQNKTITKPNKNKNKIK